MGAGFVTRLRTVQPKACVLHTSDSVHLHTTLDSTTDITAYIAGYSRGCFFTSVTSNTSATPAIYLDASYDGTTYRVFATVHADLTTTANQRVVSVSPLPQYCRLRYQHASTTTTIKAAVRCLLQP